MSDFQMFKLQINDVELLNALQEGKGMTTLRTKDGFIVTLHSGGVYEDGIMDDY